MLREIQFNILPHYGQCNVYQQLSQSPQLLAAESNRINATTHYSSRTIVHATTHNYFVCTVTLHVQVMFITMHFIVLKKAVFKPKVKVFVGGVDARKSFEYRTHVRFCIVTLHYWEFRTYLPQRTKYINSTTFVRKYFVPHHSWLQSPISC